ncbi:Single-stranded DNA-binding protein 3 [Aphelenchoides bicaudatus]|nr:Single-stranded DNA-binding protein 3 [Aphelenchoides bicaudatus]
MYHNNQRKVQPSISQNETEARAKLAQYVYQYLCQNGAPKAAEAFKLETQSLADLSQINFGNDGTGFLYEWWRVFWDLYSATPDRQDKSVPTLEAKAFVDMFHSYGPVATNGQPPAGPPMNIPPHDPSMIGNFYRPGQNVGPSSQSSPIPGYYGNQARFPHPMAPRPGMQPTQVGPNGFAPAGYANDPRMMMPNRMPNNPRPLNFPPNMRPVRPGMYNPQFMDSPTTPTFPPGALMQNGGGMNGPPMMGIPPNYDPSMIMHPSASMNPQFPMMCDGGSATPTSSSAGPTSVPNVGGCAPNSVPSANIGGPSSVGSGHNMPASVSADGHALSSLLNGGDSNIELKQSPSSVQGVVMNGGTPIQHNPGSAAALPGGPGSVHSQTGAPNSVNANMNNPQMQSTPQSHGAQLTPTSAADNLLLDYQSSGDLPGDGEHDEGKMAEISKIKASLIEGFGDKSTPNYGPNMHKYLSSS